MSRGILFIDQYRSFGGGQTVLVQTMQEAQRAGYRLLLLAPRGGDFEGAVRAEFAEGVEFYDLPELTFTHGRKGVGDVFRLAFGSLGFGRYLPPAARYDLVYVNGPRWFLPAHLWCGRKPRLYHVHLNFSRVEKRLVSWISKSALTRAIVTVSEFVHQELARAHARKLVLIENSLPPKWSELPFAGQAEETVRRVAVVGRVSLEKGQHLVIDLAAEFPEIEFLIMGDSDFAGRQYYDALRARAPKNVQWLGKITDWGEEARRRGVEISIVPSVWEEPFGLVAIESMALSLLTLVSERGGLIGIARKTGALTFSDAAKLRAQLHRLSAMPREQREALAREQHGKALAHYSARHFSAKISALLADLT